MSVLFKELLSEGIEQCVYDSSNILGSEYNEIKNELNYVKTSGWNETVYNTLESIHSDKIFPLWKELDRVGDSYGRIDEITDKFNTLEDVLVNCLEIYKEWKTLNDEFNNSVEELNSLIIFSISRL